MEVRQGEGEEILMYREREDGMRKAIQTKNTCKVNNHAITYSKRHGMGNAKLRNIPCPQWLEMICQTDLPTSATE